MQDDLLTTLCFRDEWSQPANLSYNIAIAGRPLADRENGSRSGPHRAAALYAARAPALLASAPAGHHFGHPGFSFSCIKSRSKFKARVYDDMDRIPPSDPTHTGNRASARGCSDIHRSSLRGVEMCPNGWNVGGVRDPTPGRC